MKNRDFGDWAAATLRRKSLSEPSETALRRAFAIAARPSRRRMPVWLATAAVLLVGVAGVILLTGNEGPPLPQRGGETTVRGGELTLLEPEGTLEAVPGRFRWTPVPGASEYRLRVYAVDDRVLLDVRTSEAEFVETAGLTLDAGVGYSWGVDALDEDGVILARSLRTDFRARP